MAKINFEFDTATKEMTLTMDGKSIDNVMGISCYKNSGMYGEDSGGDDYSCSISTMTQSSDEGYKTFTNIVAKDTSEGRKAFAEGACQYKDNPLFIVKKSISKAVSDTIKFLKNYRNVK
jgi:hypothetical protein